MPAISATAPGKIILFGEHAVVYARPGLAVPVTQVQARAAVFAQPTAASGSVWIDAPDIGLTANLADLPGEHPLPVLFSHLLPALGINHLPACKIRITSTIPLAAGLGSGAAVSVAVIRAVADFVNYPLSDEAVSHLAYFTEQYYHGNPSGIDNTVIAYNQPIFFVRGQPFERIIGPQPFTLVIADSGLKSSTAEVVGDVRQHWQVDTARFERLFDEVADISIKARKLIQSGEVDGLGPLMNANHAILQEMTVSCPELDRLVNTARQSGALGAKLSGGGRGGNMIALVQPHLAESVSQALLSAGATRTITTIVKPFSAAKG